MTRFKELFKHMTSSLGSRKFTTAISQEDRLDPHEIMDKCLDTYYTLPSVTSGVNNIIMFLIGNSIEWKSDDEYTQKTLNAWMNARPYVKGQIIDGATLSLVCGNNYTEPKITEEGKFDGFLTFPDPSRVFRNLDDPEDIENYWILQMPESVRSNKEYNIKRFIIKYVIGDIIWERTVWGIGLAKSHYVHFKNGISRDGIYGRSFIAATTNDADIVQDILKNVSTIAKYKAMNTKLIMPAGDQETFTEDEMEFMEQQMLNIRDGENVVVNKKIEQQSIVHQGEYDSMSTEIDYLRRDIGSGLTPNYLTPWSQDTARATASEAKIPFKLMLEYWQTMLEGYYTGIILNQLKKHDSKLQDAELKFGDVQLETWDSIVANSGNMYRDGVITFNEYRQMCGLKSVDKGDVYSWNLQVGADSALALTNSIKVAKLAQESMVIQPAPVQDANIIGDLASKPAYYHASDIEDLKSVPRGRYVTYSLPYARTLNKKFIYKVAKPSNFKHTPYIGSRHANYHLVLTAPIKVKKVLQ